INQPVKFPPWLSCLPGELSMPYNSTCASQTLRPYEASCHCNWDSRLDCVDHSCSFRSGPPRLGRLDSSFNRDSNMLWLQFPAHLGGRPGRFSPTSIVSLAVSKFAIAQTSVGDILETLQGGSSSKCLKRKASSLLLPCLFDMGK